MPVYEFRCRKCDRRFEELVGAHVGLEPGDVRCPGCGATDPERLLTSGYAPQSRRLTANEKRRLEGARGTDRGGAKQRFRAQRAAERRRSGRGG